ncbi:hypothetical protein ABT160_44825 [Streptomyces sp. NPDC001941]|uniref:hypothetical protein n=1 Tax=Streptomyces sp. NPDC001941 TaxID=3154659 RepID=UPI00332D1AEA
MHRPGLPEDLPPADLLWTRWAALATALARTRDAGDRHRTGWWIDDDGLRRDDAGCTWWTLADRGAGRFVLYGEDESSAVKWHEPRIDVLAGAPDWLPFAELEDLLRGWELGCVYWYEDGAWARAPYPEGLKDDGLDCGAAGCLVSADEAALNLGGEAEVERVHARAFLAHAERRAVTDAVLAELAGHLEEADLPAMRETARRAGLLG